MHIPDGYLSPSTCAAMYAASAPFWYIALRRLRRALSSRVVPLLSLFAALSFVVMLFNLPLPGGTTGHAVGAGMAAVVLGPWESVLAISVALMMQALFFGDGGITALGANCFNMAVAGSLTAFAIYRLLAGRSELTSTRRMVAAGLAGYCSINVAAILTAIEFGIQPALFHDAAGAPLYAPYPLGITLPAMMIGHLTFAGMAELILAGGVVAWLQRTDPTLLRRASGLPTRPADFPAPAQAGSWRSYKALWVALGILLIMAPLGLLAVGSAWGEWAPEEFANAPARRQITAASRNVPPPARAPEGMQRLYSIWTAPFPRYAPPALRSPALGYTLSGMFGVGIIILAMAGLRRLMSRPGTPDAC